MIPDLCANLLRSLLHTFSTTHLTFRPSLEVLTCLTLIRYDTIGKEISRVLPPREAKSLKHMLSALILEHARLLKEERDEEGEGDEKSGGGKAEMVRASVLVWVSDEVCVCVDRMEWKPNVVTIQSHYGNECLEAVNEGRKPSL
jgi:hypothetical protein